MLLCTTLISTFTAVLRVVITRVVYYATASHYNFLLHLQTVLKLRELDGTKEVVRSSFVILSHFLGRFHSFLILGYID